MNEKVWIIRCKWVSECNNVLILVSFSSHCTTEGFTLTLVQLFPKWWKNSPNTFKKICNFDIFARNDFQKKKSYNFWSIDRSFPFSLCAICDKIPFPNMFSAFFNLRMSRNESGLLTINPPPSYSNVIQLRAPLLLPLATYLLDCVLAWLFVVILTADFSMSQLFLFSFAFLSVHVASWLVRSFVRYIKLKQSIHFLLEIAMNSSKSNNNTTKFHQTHYQILWQHTNGNGNRENSFSAFTSFM